MRVLIIGFGSIGKRYFEIFKKLKCKVRVYDTKYKLKINENFLLKSLNEAKLWDPEIVVICNNSNKHIDTLRNILSKNIKSFLIEKPLDTSFKKIESLNNLDAKYKKKIFVVNNINYFKPIKIIKKELYKIGKINFSNIFFGHNLNEMRKKITKNHYIAKKNRSGGLILDCVHEIFYSIYLFGLVKKIKIDKFKISNLNINYEDLAKITLFHKNNIMSFITLDFIQFIKNRGCEIYGKKGTIIWKSLGKKNPIMHLKIINKDDKNNETYVTKKLKFDFNHQYEEMINELINFSKGKDTHKNLLSLKVFLKLNSKLKRIYLN